jgi:hypothetical protein
MKHRKKNPDGRGTLRPHSAMEKVMTLARPLAVSGLDLAETFRVRKTILRSLAMKTLKKLRAKMRKWMEGGPRRQPARQARPQVEALDGRVLPSSVPWLAGKALNFFDFHAAGIASYSTYNGRSLQVVAEHDNGNGTGTFSGLYQGNYGCAAVTGTISFKAYYSGSSPSYDFGISYSGVGTSYLGGIDIVQGGGDIDATWGVGSTSYYYYAGYTPQYYSGWSSELFNVASSAFCYVNHQDGAFC